MRPEVELDPRILGSVHALHGQVEAASVEEVTLHRGLYGARCPGLGVAGREPSLYRGPHRASVLPTLPAESSHTSENRQIYKTIPLPTPYFFKHRV